MQSCILVIFSILQGDFLHCYSDIILVSEQVYYFVSHVNDDLPGTGFIKKFSARVPWSNDRREKGSGLQEHLRTQMYLPRKVASGVDPHRGLWEAMSSKQ